MTEARKIAGSMDDISSAADRATYREQIPMFDFTEGSFRDTKIISPVMLARSIRRESGLAGIRSIPVQYWTLYGILTSMLEARNINYLPGDIYVQANSSKAYLTDEDTAAGYTQKNAPINKWRFDKVICQIQMPNIAAEVDNIQRGRNASIAISLNKEGLVVAFGMNVHVCMNFSVLGGTVLRSYGSRGDGGTPWELIKNRVEHWLDNINQLWTVQNEIMHMMMDYRLPSTAIIEELMGGLYVGAVKQAYFKNAEPMPFTINDLSDFAQTMIRERKEETKVNTLWDVYNWGTDIMKPGKFDIGEIADNSNMWANYLLDKYLIVVPEYEILS